MFLKQSTQIVVKIGPYLDKTDGVTEETGLAGAATEISKSPGAAFGAGPTLGTHDAEGWYPITLTTSHTDTVGRLVVKGHDSATHLPVWHEFYVLEEAIYDAMFAASSNAFTGAAGASQLTDIANDVIDAAVIADNAIDAGAIAANAITAAKIATDAITADKIAADAIGASELATDAVNEIRDAILDDATRFSGADIAAILADTDELVTDINSFAVANSTVSGTPTTTAFDTGLTAADDIYNDLVIVFTSGTQAGAARPIQDYANTNGRITLETADALPGAPSAGDAFYILAVHVHPTSQIAQAVLSEDASSYTTNSTVGAIINDWEDAGRLDAILDARASQTTADAIETDTQDIQTKIGTPAGASVSADIATVDTNVDTLVTRIPDTLSLANINAEVDTALVDIGLDHLLSAAVIGTDVADNSVLAKLVSGSATADWDDFVNTTDSLQAVRDHVGDGTSLTEAGGTGDHLTALATASALSTAQADLDIITGADGVNLLSATQASIDAIETDTNSLNDTKIPDTLSLANINAEVDTAWTTAVADSVSTDGSLPTREQALYLVNQMLTEFAISGTTYTVKKVDGSTTLATFTLDDATNPTSITRAT